MLLYTEDTEELTVAVPDFTGKTVTQVNTLAANFGLNVQIQGLSVGGGSSAISNTQSIAKETKVPKGTVVTVHFLYNDTNDSTAIG